MRKEPIPVWQKVTITKEEAAEYRNLMKSHNLLWGSVMVH